LLLVAARGCSPENVPTPLDRDARRAIEDVRRSVTAKGRAGLGAFAAEGRRMLERGLRAGYAPRDVLVAASLAESGDGALEALLARAAAQGRVSLAPDAALLELSAGRRSGLLVALFAVPERAPPSALLAASPAPSVFLVLVDIEEPGNVGALVRTALASGAAGAICVGVTDPYHPKAVRTSLGSLFKLPLAHAAEGVQVLDALARAGVHSLAAVAREGESLDHAAWPRSSVAVLVGNESRGLAERLRGEADTRVSIDLSTAADSFCVNAAAAVCLYEAQRRLRAAKAGVSSLTSTLDLTRQER
jgi:TrmH family RNA methyltransferase